MTAAVLGDAARLDSELVRRGLVRSRARAVELVTDGRVVVGGATARKPSQPVRPDEDIRVDSGREYVSRGAHKLIGALDDLGRLAPGAVSVAGARCLDAGASTGGFTEVLLERGAAHVVAADVGHDQLASRLREDPRVTALEGCNIRTIHPGSLGPAPAIVVADLSFISLTLVSGALLGVVRPGADLLLLVKPQFEVGRNRLGSGGVVVDTAQRARAVLTVARSCAAAGGRVMAVLPSVLPGESGNREYFLWVRATATGARGTGMSGAHSDTDLEEAVEHAVRDGRPQLLTGPDVEVER